MTTFLYVVLGLAVGIGVTLIYLQERFVRDRRVLLAKGESEKVKSEQMLHELDAHWQQKFNACAAQLSDYEQRAPDLEAIEAAQEKFAAERAAWKENLEAQLKQISELQGEIAFLKGENEKLQKDTANRPPTEDYLLLSPGGHLLPGSVARAFMKKE